MKQSAHTEITYRKGEHTYILRFHPQAQESWCAAITALAIWTTTPGLNFDIVDGTALAQHINYIIKNVGV